MDHSFSQDNYCYHESPVGQIFISTTNEGICKLNFVDEPVDSGQIQLNALHPFLQKAIDELNDYFSGKLNSFSLPLDPAGTDFQKKVWNAVVEVPYGKTISYAQLSTQLGQPEAIRAIANANARNPLLIIVPCHRVIGTNGNLTGYAAGLERKKFLLELEGALVPSKQLTLL